MALMERKPRIRFLSSRTKFFSSSPKELCIFYLLLVYFTTLFYGLAESSLKVLEITLPKIQKYASNILYSFCSPKSENETLSVDESSPRPFVDDK